MTLDKSKAFTIKAADLDSFENFSLTGTLMRRIIEAENIALKNEIEANAVVVNGRKYGMLKNYRRLPPTVFGMRLETQVNMPDDWDFFIQERKPLVLTNADKIRAMTDEELAETMSERLSEDCLMCPVLKDDCPVWEYKDIECKTAMLKWLKDPVKAEEEKTDDS